MTQEPINSLHQLVDVGFLLDDDVAMEVDLQACIAIPFACT